jgi:hypothetical protein
MITIVKLIKTEFSITVIGNIIIVVIFQFFIIAADSNMEAMTGKHRMNAA